VRKTFAAHVTSLIEEAEAIGWYEQRISIGERNASAQECADHGERARGGGPRVQALSMGPSSSFCGRRTPSCAIALQGGGCSQPDGYIASFAEQAKRAPRKRTPELSQVRLRP